VCSVVLTPERRSSSLARGRDKRCSFASVVAIRPIALAVVTESVKPPI
jgi:hypothetical protein